MSKNPFVRGAIAEKAIFVLTRSEPRRVSFLSRVSVPQRTCVAPRCTRNVFAKGSCNLARKGVTSIFKFYQCRASLASTTVPILVTSALGDTASGEELVQRPIKILCHAQGSPNNSSSRQFSAENRTSRARASEDEPIHGWNLRAATT